MRVRILVICLSFILMSCSLEKKRESWKQEIFDTEMAFAQMVATEGIHKAFVAFADDSASILRDDRVFKGKAAIDEFYKNRKSDNVTLTWEPDFIDVSWLGDMAYTYGKYTYFITDSTGIEHPVEGIFHTVWKRQKDGSWKFVWD